MKIKVGDRVRYRGNFGIGPAEVVEVLGIEVTAKGAHEKYGGDAEESVDLNYNDAVFDLSNGCWAYSDQIEAVISAKD